MSGKRVLIISDLHSGHAVGLTPPKFDHAPATDASQRRKKMYAARRAIWEFYENTIKGLGQIDVLIWNGDAVDGKGHRSGGTEQITTDRIEQAQMAADSILLARGKKVYGTYGTASHTGEDEDFEDDVAQRSGTLHLGSHEWIEVNGLVFDCKHHLASSGIPTGRHNAVAKERLWNVMWNEHNESPKGDVIIRSHVHYHNYCGGYKWLGMSTPALQGLGSKYGTRRCSGTVDLGVVVFDVKSKEDFSWKAIIAKPKAQFSTLVRA